MDPYRPDEWHDFFVAGAGAAAALTGLLFVALSLHIRYIAANPTHRGLARGSLIGLVQALVISLSALVQQPASWAGLEFAFIGAFYLVVVSGYQLLTFSRAHWQVPRRSWFGMAFGSLLAVIGVVGGINVVTRAGPGLYAVAPIIVIIIVWNLRNAWFLLMGVADEYLVDSHAA